MMADTFTRAPRPVPDDIGKIALTIVDIPARTTPAGDPVAAVQGVTYEIVVLDADDQPIQRLEGNAVPYLTPAQISGLQGLMAAVRTKARAEIL